MSKVYGHGPLTEEDHILIEQLAGQGLKAPTIAAQIKKHPATVSIYMHQVGLHTALPAPAERVTYERNGRTVSRFTAEEDRVLLALRRKRKGSPEIARLMTQQFGVKRTANSIRQRLIMICSQEDCAA